MISLHWEKYFQHVCQKYNRLYKLQMPKVTPHVCRHTYCSNMARSGISVKTLQYLMRHSDISVTLNVYTHLGLADAKREIAQIEQKEQRKIRVKKSHNTAKVANLWAIRHGTNWLVLYQFEYQSSTKWPRKYKILWEVIRKQQKKRTHEKVYK